jgi:hypothetical protein
MSTRLPRGYLPYRHSLQKQLDSKSPLDPSNLREILLTHSEKSKQPKTNGVYPCLLPLLCAHLIIIFSDTKDPKLISPAYTPNSTWRNRDQFFTGTSAIEAFLTRKWEVEHNYTLRKELFAFSENRMCVYLPTYHMMKHEQADWVV